MDKIKKSFIFYFTIIIAFYLLPLLIKDTGSAIFVMLAILPMVCFTVSLAESCKNGFNIIFPIITAIIFIPTIFLYYNNSALVYTIIYGIISFIGNIIGNIYYKKSKI